MPATTITGFLMSDRACFVCSKPVEVEGEDHCPVCIEKMREGRLKKKAALVVADEEIGPDDMMGVWM